MVQNRAIVTMLQRLLMWCIINALNYYYYNNGGLIESHTWSIELCHFQ